MHNPNIQQQIYPNVIDVSNGNLAATANNGMAEINHLQQQPIHQTVIHTVPPNTLPPASNPVSSQTAVTTDTAPKTKAKEVSSTLPDLAQNLANILSNPKSKATHPVSQGHEPIQNAAVIQPVFHPEQYFQPIQPEVCLQNLQMQQQVQQNVQQVIRKLHHLGNSFWVIFDIF